MGLGKTVTSLLIIDLYFQWTVRSAQDVERRSMQDHFGSPGSVLILAPKATLSNVWLEHWKAYFPDQVPSRMVIIDNK